MKCPNCGYENKDTAKFCVHCGTALVTQKKADEKDIHTAFLYTANKAAAGEIAARSANDEQLRKNAAAWIRMHEPDLFQKKLEPDDSPLLEEIQDWDRDLRDMDYEERICTIMHVRDGMPVKDTADELGISEDLVKAELQQAFHLLNKKGTENTIPLEIPKPEKKKKRKVSIRRVRIVLISVLAVIVTVLLGVKLGVRNYAETQYQKGTDALKQGDYDNAEKALSLARRFGYEGDVEKQLGNVYAAQGKTEDAVNAWQTWYDSSQDDTGVQESLIQGYEQLADRKLNEGSTSDALNWLEKEEKINEAEFVKIRISAVKNGGLYRDRNGNEFNSFGQPIRIHTDSYELVVSYDEDHHLSGVSGQSGLNEAPSVCTDFDFSGNVNDEMEWSMVEGKLQWRNNRRVCDENGALQSEEIHTGSLNYTRTWNTDSSWTDSEGNRVSVKKEQDKQGRTSEETEMMQDNAILTKEYGYEGNGKMFSEMKVTDNGDPDPTRLAPDSYTVKSSDMDGVHQYCADILDEQGSKIGTWWYVPYNGSITVYSAD